MAVRVVVAGATGRVGRTMTSGLGQYPDVVVAGCFGSVNALAELSRLAPESDVLVDFTTGSAAPELLLAAAEAGLHVVSGTSGLKPQELDDLCGGVRRA